MEFRRRDIAALAAFATATPAMAAAEDGISRNHAAIHQDVMFAAPADRIYQTLTTASLFDRVVRASAAMNSDMKRVLGTTPTQIDARPGGAFALYGGYITGFNLQMMPGQKLVQAWHSASWKPDAWSIASFALEARGGTTHLVFDHTGFPDEDAAASLAAGWQENYWTPMAKTLA